MEDEETGRPDRVRLPGFDEQAARRSAARGWDRDDYGPGGYRRGYVRESGLRSARRASSWTAAALIAAVAATTGYLAHAIPVTAGGSTSAGGGGHATPSGKSTAAKPGAPAVSGPVVTSGGSGAAGAAGRQAGDN